MMDRQLRLDQALDALSRETGVLGVALISRDGLCVKAHGRLDLGRETFSAMSATVMGAAEIALAEIDGGSARHIVASTDKVTMVLLGATRDLLLVSYLESSASVDQLLPRMQAAAAGVSKIVLGG